MLRLAAFPCCLGLLAFAQSAALSLALLAGSALLALLWWLGLLWKIARAQPRGGDDLRP